MTRETKIGLLVGLAFIIVIGILLSDHLTSSTEPPPATLANAGSNVLQTIDAPGSNSAAQAQPLTPPQGVQPNSTVPTNADLTPRPQPVQIVQIGPGTDAQRQPITVQSDQPPQANAPPIITMPPQEQVQYPANDTPLITQAPMNPPGSLQSVAQQHGEQLVGVDQPAGSTATNWTNALTGGKEYTAQAGDSVSRMAGRFLGGNTKANRDAIIRANPSLQKDPNKVIVGQNYIIPQTSAPPAVAQVPTQAPPAAATPAPSRNSRPRNTGTPSRKTTTSPASRWSNWATPTPGPPSRS